MYSKTNATSHIFIASLIAGLALLLGLWPWLFSRPKLSPQVEQQVQHDSQQESIPNWQANFCAAHRAIILAGVALQDSPNGMGILDGIYSNNNHNHDAESDQHHHYHQNMFSILSLSPALTLPQTERTVREAWRVKVALLMGTDACIHDGFDGDNDSISSSHKQNQRQDRHGYGRDYQNLHHNHNHDNRRRQNHNQNKKDPHPNRPNHRLNTQPQSQPPSLCTRQYEALTLATRAVADPLAREWWLKNVEWVGCEEQQQGGGQGQTGKRCENEKEVVKRREEVIGILCGW